MAKLNCWEYSGCGRQPGGVNVIELGICPAAVEKRLTGTNSGTCGGRACWAVCGTFCGGRPQGSYAKKLLSCLDCDLYKLVHREETPCASTMAIRDKITPRHDDE